jgi:hypothetical protein
LCIDDEVSFDSLARQARTTPPPISSKRRPRCRRSWPSARPQMLPLRQHMMQCVSRVLMMRRETYRLLALHRRRMLPVLLLPLTQQLLLERRTIAMRRLIAQ